MLLPDLESDLESLELCGRAGLPPWEQHVVEEQHPVEGEFLVQQLRWSFRHPASETEKSEKPVQKMSIRI